MDTQTQTPDSIGPLFNPLTGWEAASRWNSAAFEWMTRGYQQWVALMTGSLVPPVTAVAAPVRQAQASEKPAATPGADHSARPVARSEAKKRPAPKRAARAKASSPKPRSRS